MEKMTWVIQDLASAKPDSYLSVRFLGYDLGNLSEGTGVSQGWGERIGSHLGLAEFELSV